MWTANVFSVETVNGRRIATIQFVNSGDASKNFTEKFDITSIALENFKSTVKSKLNVLNASDEVTAGPIGDPTIPTQAELDLADWLTKWRRWQKAKILIAHEVISGTETTVVNLKNEVVSGFKSSYVDKI